MDNYLLNRGFERLKEVNQFFEYHAWYFTKTLNADNIPYKRFYRMNDKPSTIKNFNPNLIAGTCHHNYKNMMWIEMLGALERHRPQKINTEASLHSFINNPVEIGLLKYGEEFYIQEGNHRFCTARFFGKCIDEVKVTEYVIDNPAYAKWCWFEEKGIKVEDNNQWCWTAMIYGKQVEINVSLLDNFIDYYDEVREPSRFMDRFRKVDNKGGELSIEKSDDLMGEKITSLILKDKKSRVVLFE